MTHATAKLFRFVQQLSWVRVLVAVLLAQHSIWAEQELSPRVQCKEAIAPSSGEVLQLFNGQDLSGFSTWLQDGGAEDSNAVFSVVDGTIRISGEGIGYLATVNRFKNYSLSLEYRWGKKTDGSGFVRNSGVLLHANGPDGNFKGKWMASIECQLAQGCEGDLIVLRGEDLAGKTIPVQISSDTKLAADGRTRWSREGNMTNYSGKQFWWSKHQVGFEERLDSRGENDVASPVGEWTRVECLCQADRIVIKINGVTVNECYDVFPSEGKILLENEGNEIFFRNLEIRPI